MQGFANVVIFKTRGMQLARQGLLVGVGFRLVIILEEVDEDFDH